MRAALPHLMDEAAHCAHPPLNDHLGREREERGGGVKEKIEEEEEEEEASRTEKPSILIIRMHD